MNTSITVTSLCFLTLFSLMDCSTCDINKLEGETMSFKLTDSSLKDNDRFTIKKDNQVLVPKRNRKQEGPGIVENNFLKLPDVKLSDAGSYTVEVFDGRGQNLNSYTKTVCVYAKVSKPRVNVTCQDGKIDFICDVEDSKDLSFTWEKNGEDFKMNAKVLINVEADTVTKYTCTAQNPVHNNTSDSVEASCLKTKAKNSSDTLFGFDRWVMDNILAAGGSFALFVIVMVTVACCFCKCRARQMRDKQNVLYINTSQSCSDQHLNQTTQGQSATVEIYDNISAREVAQV
ncbi:SLAM family member 5-like isoform X2 [Tachysurus vachellii]|uniref:SLAM family member 5-like isoform X2 n=1 Tax=Tachysurus vachellii TaxID=175792 RepID=UPI00296AD7E9|nr:SLAM family member 5-like isoform X2 [Tachysurus vachellii]XP_060750866.1 SLAM family member 5-like isoform X2 [Tachysurus vachellii]